MVELAQKGLDYDRICSEFNEAKPVMDLFRDFAQRNGMEVPAYLAHIRARAKQAEGLSEAEARRAVELEDREAAVAEQEKLRNRQQEEARRAAEQRQAAEERRRADVLEFREIYPEAAQSPESIPPEVWAEVRNGRTLVSAYARYSAEQARASAERQAQQQAAREQNEKNAARSAGSMRSAGADSGRGDPFLEGWDS